MLIRVANNLIYVLIAAIAALVFMWLGPGIEERINPVITDQTPTIERNGSEIKFSVLIRKGRECDFVSVGWQLLQRSFPDKRAAITVRGPGGAEIPRQSVTYPPGVFLNGPFTATLPPDFSMADEIVGRITYRCHGLWPTMQTYGPWQIPKPPPALAG